MNILAKARLSVLGNRNKLQLVNQLSFRESSVPPNVLHPVLPSHPDKMSHTTSAVVQGL
jgi:hypothetical protein